MKTTPNYVLLIQHNLKPVCIKILLSDRKFSYKNMKANNVL